MALATNGVNMKLLVEFFVDGAEVDFTEMLSLGLVEKNDGGYSLTEYGKSFLKK